MKATCCLTMLLLSLTSCQDQNSSGTQLAPDEAYRRQLVRLVTALQKNPWSGWESGTEVVVRHIGDNNPAASHYTYVLPDMLYKVVEADKRLVRTEFIDGKPGGQHDFSIECQPGLDAASIPLGEARTTDVQIDGFMLTCLLSESRLDVLLGGPSIVTREWTLADHPSILLRKETNGVGWRVKSIRVIKKIGEKEFPCLEIERRMSIYSDGHLDVITTQFLNPDIPGHLVEEIKEFSRVKKDQERSTPHMVIHQKVVLVSVQEPARP